MARIIAAGRNRTGGYVCVTGVHGVMESQRDGSLRDIQNGSMLTTPDGMPTVWVGRFQGFRSMRRVYGPDLMLKICDEARAVDHVHFLFGGGVGVAEALQQRLAIKYPGIRIAGAETPPFRPLSPTEEAQLASRLEAHGVHYCWIGLSTPKQERLASRLSRLRPQTVFLGVGAAFDMNAGLLAQAPTWMQRAGLEWLFRPLAEPRRLWKRYFRNNPEFLARMMWQVLRRGRSTVFQGPG